MHGPAATIAGVDAHKTYQEAEAGPWTTSKTFVGSSNVYKVMTLRSHSTPLSLARDR
jgi:hypothetical protein